VFYRNGEAELSIRELEILRLLGNGNNTAAIAAKLHISRTTVNNHVQHILRKLGATIASKRFAEPNMPD
jgi:DNA-binding CsgD family transcriptional regulator